MQMTDIAPDGAPEPAPDQPTAVEPPGDLDQGDTWERDENSVTLSLRAATTLVAGALLAWAQYKAPIMQARDWGRWAELSVVANFVLPLGIVWMFFGQGLSYLDWLGDQKFNAWSYGWNFRTLRRQCLIAVVLFLAMLGPLWWFARQPSTHSYYATYFPQVQGAGPWLGFLGLLILYMFCWEWFFRGFLLFGMAQGFGFVVAIVLQAAIFGMAHAGKPGLEFWSSFAGGIVIGAVAWHEKSFVPAFLTHTLIQIALAVMLAT
jgi:membrane protease YdiL (CAAX protease family)